MSVQHDTSPERPPEGAAHDRDATILDAATRFAAEIVGEVADVLDVDGTQRELADLRAALADAQRALDERRPAPDPRVLGQALKRAWFRQQRASFGLSDADNRWTAAAETAIDVVRGLWPSHQTAAEGGRDDALAPGAPSGGEAPALGGTDRYNDEVAAVAHDMWTHDAGITGDAVTWHEVIAGVRQFYLRRAERVVARLVERGWTVRSAR